MLKEEICRKLIETVPEFRVFYLEILEDNDEEILLYPIFGELSNYYLECFRKKNEDVLKKINFFLETLLVKEDKDLNNLVAVGFLENLVNVGEDYSKLKKDLPSSLQDLILDVDNFWNCR